jgi:hypothetical protein
MVSDSAAAIRLDVPSGYAPAGIEGNLAIFSTPSGAERKYPIPIFDGAMCRVEATLLQPDILNGEVLCIKHLLVDPRGKLQATISIEPGGDAFWVVASITKTPCGATLAS